MESSLTATPEKFVPTSLTQLKNHTKALKRELSRCDIDIPHASLLHVVAKSFDFENYHAAEAILGKPAKPPRRSPKNKTSSDMEEYDLLMMAIREEIGEIKFNYAMRIHPHYRGIMYNPLATLDELGYYTFKQQAKLAVRIFADLNVKYLDISLAYNEDRVGLIEYFEIERKHSDITNTAEAFYVKNIVGGKKVYYSPEPKNPHEIIIDDQISNFENVVFCAWPSKNETRKQYIMPFDDYYNFIAGYYIPDGGHWTIRYKHNVSGKRIYDGQSRYLNEKMEQSQRIRDRIQQRGMPTEEEVATAKENAFANVKRGLMISGLTSGSASAVAKWCVNVLGYDFAPITRATSWFLSDTEGVAWDKNVHKENVGEILPIIIYAEAVYEALKGSKKDSKLDMEEIADDWRRFALTAGGRKEIERLLSTKEEFTHLMNENIALILNMSYDDALQLVNDSCVYRLDQIEYKDLLE